MKGAPDTKTKTKMAKTKTMALTPQREMAPSIAFSRGGRSAARSPRPAMAADRRRQYLHPAKPMKMAAATEARSRSQALAAPEGSAGVGEPAPAPSRPLANRGT